MLWTAQALPSVTGLIASPDGLASPEFQLPPGALALIDTEEPGAQIVDWFGPVLRVQIVASIAGEIAVVLPLDRLFDSRAAAALRLWRALNGRAPGPNAAALSKTRRDRLVLALRALDGRLADASYRQIAQALFDIRDAGGPAWKSHDVRDRTIRLVRYGRSLMDGDYRRLLLHPYRRR